MLHATRRDPVIPSVDFRDSIRSICNEYHLLRALHLHTEDRNPARTRNRPIERKRAGSAIFQIGFLISTRLLATIVLQSFTRVQPASFP